MNRFGHLAGPGVRLGFRVLGQDFEAFRVQG